MKSLVKKIVLALTLSSAAVAATVLTTKDEVNNKVAALTAPYNNATTKMSFAFTDLIIDEIRTLNFGVQAHVSKIGPKNSADLTLSDISYSYNDANPTVTAKLTLKTNLVKLIGQEAINEMAADFKNLAESLLNDYTSEYGDAVKVKAVVDNLVQDPNGNVSSARIRVAVTLDYNKLPGDVAVENIDFKKSSITLSATTDGLTGSATVALNPLHHTFKMDQNGLREYILALLNNDSEAYEEIGHFLSFADQTAEWIVNQDATAEGAE